jgi:hypothetical protein
LHTYKCGGTYLVTVMYLMAASSHTLEGAGVVIFKVPVGNPQEETRDCNVSKIVLLYLKGVYNFAGNPALGSVRHAYKGRGSTKSVPHTVTHSRTSITSRLYATHLW